MRNLPFTRGPVFTFDTVGAARNALLSALVGIALLTGCNNKTKEIENLQKELAELKAKEKQNEDKRKLQDEIAAVKDGELEGSIFIVTKARENVKLGLVIVSLFDPDLARKSLQKRHAELRLQADEIANKARPLLKPVSDTRQEYEKARTAWNIALHLKYECAKTLEEKFNAIPGHTTLDYVADYDHEPVYFDSLDSADSIKRKKAIYAELHPKVVAANDALKIADKTSDQKHREYLDAVSAFNSVVRAQRDFIANYPTLCLSALDTPISSTKTDGDGKFKLPVPKSREFVLTASASREVGDKSESYVWVVANSLNGKDHGEILLSNDTMVDAYARPSVVERLGVEPLEFLDF